MTRETDESVNTVDIAAEAIWRAGWPEESADRTWDDCIYRKYYRHMAQAAINALQLTEEVSVRVGQLSGCVMSPHDLESHHTVIARRWVSEWTPEQEKS